MSSEGSRIFGKVIFFIIAVPIAIVLGMVFPGVAHAVLAHGVMVLYRKIFP